MDSSCDTSQCCCLDNYITVIQTSNVIQLTGGATGLCTNYAPTVALTQTVPTGFQTVVNWYGEAIRISLGLDNAYLAFVNIQHPYCSATAMRTSYSAGSMKRMNLVLIIFILPIIIGIMK